MDKGEDAFRTIGEADEELGVPQHVLRFWETRFAQIKPMKRGGGRRYYRPIDMALLRAIHGMLYGQGYTIKGVQRILKEQGVRAVLSGDVGVAVDSAGDDKEAAQGEPVILDDARLRGALVHLQEARRVLAAAR